MNTVRIIGAGQLGSRHLQALRAIRSPLHIEVIDPAQQSLERARERYAAAPSGAAHTVSYSTGINGDLGPTDVAIVATASADRRTAIERLLSVSSVRFMVLEKLLFTRARDFAEVGKVLDRTNTRAWVNCPMRMMPFYRDLRSSCAGGPVDYRVTGSGYGLITSVIHFIDHMAFLSGCHQFSTDTSRLDARPVPSKRPGYWELTGTLDVTFEDGSRGRFSSEANASSPYVVEIFGRAVRAIVREIDGLAWMATEAEGWRWTEVMINLPFQSQLTSIVIEDLLAKGDCELTPYTESAQAHLAYLQPVWEFVQGTVDDSSGCYQFT